MFEFTRFRRMLRTSVPVDNHVENSAKSESSKARIEKNVRIINHELEIGDYTFVGENTVLGPNLLQIGMYCSIASGCIIGPNMHPLDEMSTSAVFYSPSWGVVDTNKKSMYNNRETVIEHDVWIGHNAIIMPGVVLQTGCVVGAGAVVTKTVEPYQVVGGNPAKCIKSRFDEATCRQLLASEWWLLPIQEAVSIYRTFK